MSFKPLQITDNTKETIQRFQQNVGDAFRELGAPSSVPVLEVLSSATIAQYAVKPEDLYIVVNARGGPIKIVLPTPARSTQIVRILNAYNSGKVTIAQADGGVMGNLPAAFVLDGDTSATMVNTGRAWFRFGPA